jgi:hypothetical protein
MPIFRTCAASFDMFEGSRMPERLKSLCSSFFRFLNGWIKKCFSQEKDVLGIALGEKDSTNAAQKNVQMHFFQGILVGCLPLNLMFHLRNPSTLMRESSRSQEGIKVCSVTDVKHLNLFLC